MNKYYVYCHCFQDSNEIFYIGKGAGKRLLSKDRSPLWNSLVASRQYYSMKIKDKLSEYEAFALEQELLQEFPTLGNVRRINNMAKRIVYDDINDVIEYDETSPTFLRWRQPINKISLKAGNAAGSFTSSGYGQICINYSVYRIHRIIYCLFSKEDLDSNLIIDHIDGNKANNNISNLRLTTAAENSRNIKWETARPSNTGERGISLRGSCYRITWGENGKRLEKQFFFGKRSNRTKEESLELAICFRDSLVDQGFISIVNW